MSVILYAYLAAALFLGISFSSRFIVGKSRLFPTKEEAHFPVVSGYNLDREEFVFPRDFGAEYNLVIVAFEQYHQNAVNTWIPFLQEVEAFHPSFMYYELPTIRSLPVVPRTFINEGMRAGIPDQTARERTVTLYLDKEVFKDAVNISNEEEIHLLLVDKVGNILWRGSGPYSEDKADHLVDYLQSVEEQEGE